MMQQRKYSKTPFVWPGLLLAALLLVCLSGRKPVVADGGAVGEGSGEVTAAAVGSAMDRGVGSSHFANSMAEVGGYDFDFVDERGGGCGQVAAGTAAGADRSVYDLVRVVPADG